MPRIEKAGTVLVSGTAGWPQNPPPGLLGLAVWSELGMHIIPLPLIGRLEIPFIHAGLPTLVVLGRVIRHKSDPKRPQDTICWGMPADPVRAPRAGADRSGKSAEYARSERITDTSCAAFGSEFGHGVPLPGIGSGAIRFGEAVAADSPNRRDVGHQADFPACHDSGATRKRRCNPILTRKFLRSNLKTGKTTIPAEIYQIGRAHV